MNLDVDGLLIQSQNDVLRDLVRTLDLHAPGEALHAERVSVYATATGERLGMSDRDLIDLRRASLLHDVGKIAISPDILMKPGVLEDEDWDLLRKHAEHALHILESLPWLARSIPMIRHHHEWIDGSGYPDGLQGDEIPLGARIIAVAEAFDALIAGSFMKDALPEQAARAELANCCKTQFDQVVIDAFFEVQCLIQPLRRG